MIRCRSIVARVTVATTFLIVNGHALWADTRELTTRVGSTTVSYKVALPQGYDPAKTYPAVLAFGGGPQTMNTVNRVLARNLEAEAGRRGYIVVAPAAPDGDLFFQEGVRIFPAFLQQMLATYKIEGGKFHAAGPSNGGIAAMHVAAAFPQYFKSATAFPGYLWQPTPPKLEAMAGICVFMFVGEHDDYRWHGEMKREVDALRARGTLAVYSEEKGQPHGIATLADAGARRLFDNFEQARKSCTTR